jgi:CheY-like chemotaxis protein
MPPACESDAVARVRVLVVDDTDEVRTLLRLVFEGDDRFELVGEGVDGIEAIELSSELHPDLIVLDRQMPRLGGVEALPEIRRASPASAIVLFTAAADAGTYHAAMSAGALGVVEKTVGIDLIDHLADTLVERVASPDADVHVRVGPVSSASARVWIDNTRGILQALADHPEVLDEPVPDEVCRTFETFLDRWDGVTRESDEFVWSARAPAAEVQRRIEWWAVIDRMNDDQLAVLGVGWSPPEARPFFRALTEGVLDALDQHATTRPLAEVLRPQWESGA